MLTGVRIACAANKINNEASEMPFEVHRLKNEQECASIWEEWRELNESVEPRNPFGAPLWNWIWWKHFSKKSIGVAREFFVHTVRDDEGKLRAVAPWMIDSRPGAGPLRLRILTTFGADASLTEIRGVVCRSEDEAEVMAALQAYLRQYENRFDAVEWAGVRTYDALDLLEAEGQLSFVQVGHVYMLPLPESWKALCARVGSNMRKYLRRSGEKFDALGKAMHLNVISDKAEIEQGMERFFKLHSMRAETTDMFVHPDKFKNTPNRNFILEVFTKLAEQNIARIFEARVEGQIVACRICFVLGRTVYVYYSGYDPKWREYNVGTLMMSKIIQWAIDNNFKDINLSAGKDRSKMQWRPTEHIFQGGVRIRPGLRGNLVSRFYTTLNTLKSRRQHGSANPAR
jgi:CelD/BcsL family acetyltransferase involved in cellulose biosynthesis